MLAKNGVVQKAEIKKRLGLAQDQVNQVLLAVESDSNWKDIHAQTEMAIMTLRKATKLLARYHLEVCIVGKHRKMNLPITHEDIDEIMKTYRYLN